MRKRLTVDGAGSAGAGTMLPISCADEDRANAATVKTTAISLWGGVKTADMTVWVC